MVTSIRRVSCLSTLALVTLFAWLSGGCGAGAVKDEAPRSTSVREQAQCGDCERYCYWLYGDGCFYVCSADPYGEDCSRCSDGYQQCVLRCEPELCEW